MIELILFHWATYLFLFSLLVIAIGNFWPRLNPSRARLQGRDARRASSTRGPGR